MRVTVWLVLLLGCSSELPGPAQIAWGSESCASCRMVISDKRFSAQIVSPSHDPIFFDEIDCLAKWVAAHPLSDDSRVFVSDYSDSGWIPAREASWFRCRNVATPMNSGLIAARRTGTAASCPKLEASQLFGRKLP
ncbi:MAG TPA: nitrous oxide reductase accessory protein NosL [Thermoanaerobaculia bacterium]|nr:nitrous oxide reductase accessory protein NosL [Thermoanaerobaculia bacterium]